MRWAVAAIGVLWSASPVHVRGWQHVYRVSALQKGAAVMPFRAAGVCLPCRLPGSARPLGGRREGHWKVIKKGVSAARAADRCPVLSACGLHSSGGVASEPANIEAQAPGKGLGLVNKGVYQDGLQCLRLAWHRRHRLLPDEEFSVIAGRDCDAFVSHASARVDIDGKGRIPRAQIPF